MPGQTSNQDILQGINQIIQAINDLKLDVTTETVINGDVGDVPVTDEEMSAQSASPTGYTAKDPNDDACKRAHFQYDGIYKVIETFADQNILSLISLGGTFVVAAILFAFGHVVIAGTVTISAAFGVGGKVVGYLGGVATALGRDGVNLTQILLHLTNRKEDIICMFYSQIELGGNTGGARAGLRAILIDDGISFSNLAVIEAIYTTAFAATLFKDVLDEITGINTTANALANYTPADPVDCSGCTVAGNCPGMPGIEVSLGYLETMVDEYGDCFYRITSQWHKGQFIEDPAYQVVEFYVADTWYQGAGSTASVALGPQTGWVAPSGAPFAVMTDGNHPPFMYSDLDDVINNTRPLSPAHKVSIYGGEASVFMIDVTLSIPF